MKSSIYLFLYSVFILVSLSAHGSKVGIIGDINCNKDDLRNTIRYMHDELQVTDVILSGSILCPEYEGDYMKASGLLDIISEKYEKSNVFSVPGTLDIRKNNKIAPNVYKTHMHLLKQRTTLATDKEGDEVINDCTPGYLNVDGKKVRVSSMPQFELGVRKSITKDGIAKYPFAYLSDKNFMERCDEKDSDEKVDFDIFSATKLRTAFKDGNTTTINPGSFSKSSSTSINKSYAVLDTDDGRVDFYDPESSSVVREQELNSIKISGGIGNSSPTINIKVVDDPKVKDSKASLPTVLVSDSSEESSSIIQVTTQGNSALQVPIIQEDNIHSNRPRAGSILLAPNRASSKRVLSPSEKERVRKLATLSRMPSESELKFPKRSSSLHIKSSSKMIRPAKRSSTISINKSLLLSMLKERRSSRNIGIKVFDRKKEDKDQSTVITKEVTSPPGVASASKLITRSTELSFPLFVNQAINCSNSLVDLPECELDVLKQFIPILGNQLTWKSFSKELDSVKDKGNSKVFLEISNFICDHLDDLIDCGKLSDYDNILHMKKANKLARCKEEEAVVKDYRQETASFKKQHGRSLENLELMVKRMNLDGDNGELELSKIYSILRVVWLGEDEILEKEIRDRKIEKKTILKQYLDKKTLDSIGDDALKMNVYIQEILDIGSKSSNFKDRSNLDLFVTGASQRQKKRENRHRRIVEVYDAINNKIIQQKNKDDNYEPNIEVIEKIKELMNDKQDAVALRRSSRAVKEKELKESTKNVRESISEIFLSK